jgi:CheY-like chemotaxis protein
MTTDMGHSDVPIRDAVMASDPVACAPESRALRVLVAEDNPFNRRVIVAALGRLGQVADVVGDGRAAVDAVADTHYDLVLMDVMMPGLDGLAATREICARWSAGERPRIVAITAQANAGDHDECMAAGMADSLCKPLDPRRLAAILHDCPRRADG